MHADGLHFTGGLHKAKRNGARKKLAAANNSLGFKRPQTVHCFARAHQRRALAEISNEVGHPL
jgi:hypothetical protein